MKTWQNKFKFLSSNSPIVEFPMLLVLILGVFGGYIVFFVMNNGSFFYAGLFSFFLIIPFILIFNQFAKKICIAIIILTIPLIIDKTLNLHEFHQGGAQGYKISLHDIVLGVVYIILFFEMYRKREQKLHLFLRYSIPFGGIMIMAVISMINAEFRYYSLFEFVEIFKMYLVFIFIANYIRDTGDLKVIINFVILGLTIEVLFVLMELFTGQSIGIAFLGTKAVEDPGQFKYMRLGGTFGGSNGLAWYFDIILPLVLAVFLSHMKKFKKIYLFAILTGGIFCLIMTYSRGGWISFLITASIVGMAIFLKYDLKKQIRAGLIVSMLVFLGFIYLIAIPNPISNRFNEDDKGSATSRLPLMELAIDMIRSAPLTGVGLNNYTEVHHKYDFGVDKITEYYPVPVHNIFLMVAAEIGLPGLFFFVLFWMILIIDIIRFTRHKQGFHINLLLGIMGGIIGFFIQGLVENTSLGSINFYPVWIFSGVAVGLLQREKKN